MRKIKSSRNKLKGKSKLKLFLSTIFLTFLIGILLASKLNLSQIHNLVFTKIFPNKTKVEIIRKPAVINIITTDILLDSIESSSGAELRNFEASRSAFFTADKDGMILSKESNPNFPSIILTANNLNLGSKINSEWVKNSLKIFDKLKTFNLNINEGKIYPETIFLLKSKDNNLKIIFDLNKNVELQLAALQLLLEQAKMNGENMELIDLRFDKPVVKYIPKKG